MILQELICGGADIKRCSFFTFDAHPDNYLKDDSSYDSTWAWKLGREGRAIVIHMPSYFDGEYKQAKTNWRQRGIFNYAIGSIMVGTAAGSFEEQYNIVGEKLYPEWAVYLHERYRDAVDRVWVTIDYDFFSLLSEVENPRMDVRVSDLSFIIRKMIDKSWHPWPASLAIIRSELEMVIPSMPSDCKEYFNLPKEIRKRTFYRGSNHKNSPRAFDRLPRVGIRKATASPLIKEAAYLPA